MLRVGIDICDDYTQVACYDPRTMEAESIGLTEEEASSMVPTVVCKEKGADSWFIGEEEMWIRDRRDSDIGGSADRKPDRGSEDPAEQQETGRERLGNGWQETGCFGSG